jgi:hypothetical protein
MREILGLEASTAPDDNTTILAKGDAVVRRAEMPYGSARPKSAPTAVEPSGQEKSQAISIAYEFAI